MNLGKCLVGSVVSVATAGLVAGCGGHDKAPASSSSAASPTSSAAPSSATKAAPATYDIARVSTAKSALPPGFDADDIPADTVNEQQMDAAGIGGLSAAPPTVVTPPECAVTLKPFGPVGVGAKAHGFMATQGQHMIVVMAAQSDKPAADISRSGCDHITATSPNGVNATVEQIAGPDIPGVKSVGRQAHVTADGKTIDEVTFTAALGDKTIVVVQGDVPAATMSDVLVKAVAAMQG